jgi:hypothetical protein
MAWYYYTGTVPRPIAVKKGLSVSVRPYTKVEILDETLEVKALIRKKQLRRTGKPKGSDSVVDAPVTDTGVRVDVIKSDMAKVVAEKGKTSASGIAPVSKSEQEMTDGELGKVHKFESGEERKAEGIKEDESVTAEKIDQAVEMNDDIRRKLKKGRQKK